MNPDKTNPLIRSKLIAAGIRNLKDFGYPGVTAENILTDLMYSAFFDRMLEDHSGKGKAEADELRAEIAKNKEASK